MPEVPMETPPARKIAIIDDSVFMRTRIRWAVEEAFPGADIREFVDGQAGLEGLPGFGPDLVLLDMLMPRLSGTDVLRKLREGGSAVPVLVITADVQEAVRKRVEELGAIGLIHKPFSHEKLIGILTGLTLP